MGIGYSSHQEAAYGDSMTKAATYNFGMGGLSIEYVRGLSSVVDLSFGALFTTGTLKLDLYQYGSSYGSFGQIFGELGNNSGSNNLTRDFSVRFYGVQPMIGVGVLIKKAFYLRLQAGYNVAIMGTWKVDNSIPVNDFPTTIKPNGFNINLGIDFGLFFRED